jgi:hypothetical protein
VLVLSVHVLIRTHADNVLVLDFSKLDTEFNLLGNSGKPVTLETLGFDKVLETCFSGTGNSRFSEVWNLRSLGFANV